MHHHNHTHNHHFKNFKIKTNFFYSILSKTKCYINSSLCLNQSLDLKKTWKKILKTQDAAKAKPNAKTSTSTTSPNDHSFKEMPDDAGKMRKRHTRKKKHVKKRKNFGMDTCVELIPTIKLLCVCYVYYNVTF